MSCNALKNFLFQSCCFFHYESLEWHNSLLLWICRSLQEMFLSYYTSPSLVVTVVIMKQKSSSVSQSMSYDSVLGFQEAFSSICKNLAYQLRHFCRLKGWNPLLKILAYFLWSQSTWLSGLECYYQNWKIKICQSS